MPEDPRSFDLPDEYYLEIGRIVVSWNRLESLLHHTLVLALLDDFIQDGRAAAVFAHMAFPQKLDLLRTMLQMGKTAGGPVFVTYCDRVQPLLRKCGDERNALFHHGWLDEGPGSVKRVNVSARGTFKVDVVNVTVLDLQAINTRIMSAHLALLHEIAEPLTPNWQPQQGQ